MDTLGPAVRDRFKRAYGRDATVVADAGGRVNLIGEHTDYHEGLVLPAAIDLRTVAYAAPRSDRKLRIRSESVGDSVEAGLDELAPLDDVSWRSYVLGPIWASERAGVRIGGADILVASDVPFGGGLSSSASVEVCLVGLAVALAGQELEGMQVARIARAAENGFCRVPCGAMDQVASACGREGHAILLDCRTMQVSAVEVPGDWAVVVVDSGVRHSLAAGEYAKRQEECAQGLEQLRRAYGRLAAVRDVTLEMLDAERSRLGDVAYRRLRHVVTENERVADAVGAMAAGDAQRMGALLWGSHASLAADYEVSCPELDVLVEIAGSIGGVWGARLTGAGFGGNTMNLVPAARGAELAGILVERYAAKTGRRTKATVVKASRGLTVERFAA